MKLVSRQRVPLVFCPYLGGVVIKPLSDVGLIDGAFPTKPRCIFARLGNEPGASQHGMQRVTELQEDDACRVWYTRATCTFSFISRLLMALRSHVHAYVIASISSMVPLTPPTYVFQGSCAVTIHFQKLCFPDAFFLHDLGTYTHIHTSKLILLFITILGIGTRK